ncbi:hypothetical protein BDD12DRAFT_882696 [Trichophaea hybrida]|nr:hypothetical protein BDD12DRAFT_882696 [Trichophaea hybrida]
MSLTKSLSKRSFSFKFSSSSSTSRSASYEIPKAQQRLPKAVFERINVHLRALYRNTNDETCETCITRNFSVAARTCKNWRDGMVPVMYRNVYIAGEYLPVTRKMKVKYGCRILLLQRTLSARPDYAALIQELTLPEYDPRTMKNEERRWVESTISVLISSCPNLESLQGIYIPFTGRTSDSPIHMALSTRTNLKEHLWLVSASTFLRYSESQSFVNVHRNWQGLETLVMQGYTATSGGGGLNHLTFVDIFEHLPNLRKLMISRFHDYEFDDNTLLSVPPSITHLRLGKLPGITEAGLIAFSKLLSSLKLHTLALLELEILNLTTITTLLHNLPLKKFTLLQTSSPQPGPDTGIPLYLTSKSLQDLHWDILIPGPATSIVARSIYRSYLPSLRRLRSPSDHTGVLQAVCRPCESIIQPFDLSLAAGTKHTHRYSRLLPLARIEAEHRILEAREKAFVKFVVTPSPSEDDESGVYDWMGWNGSARMWRWGRNSKNVEAKHRTVEFAGGFLGDLKSPVGYCLTPDVEGSVDALCRVGDVVGKFGVRAVCEGWGSGRKGRGNGGGGEGNGNWWHGKRGKRRKEEVEGLGILEAGGHLLTRGNLGLVLALNMENRIEPDITDALRRDAQFSVLQALSTSKFWSGLGLRES